MASASPQPHHPSLLAHTCYGWDVAASQPDRVPPLMLLPLPAWRASPVLGLTYPVRAVEL